ncbi:MAG: peptidoglycan/LPS O-acetylase OafA/YrhL [Halioglobus sp.]|jgi:peptidoglycan/LPS O-acetylase OafA/YrhL
MNTMSYINSLTGLRGLAAFIVFISHCANQGMLPAVFSHGFGQIGVMLFFILSGFLMGHLYLNKDSNVSNIKQYLIARIGRILPLYFLLILLSVLISTTIYPDFHYQITEVQIVLRALLFIDAPYEFWTIPVEVQFYAVFIVFWILYQRNVSPILLITFMALTAIPGILLYSKLGYVPALFSSYSVPFFVGIGTAIMYPRIAGSVFLNKFATYAAAPSIIALFLNLPAVRLEHEWILNSHFFVRTWADPLNWVIVYCVFFCAMLNASALHFLNTRAFVVLGEISFGFYLIHYPVLKIIKSIGILVPLQFVTSFVLISLLAWLSYKYFEQPVNKRIRGKLTELKREPSHQPVAQIHQPNFPIRTPAE